MVLNPRQQLQARSSVAFPLPRWRWLQGVRTTVTIELMDEARTGPVMTWKLTNARPMKYTGATLNAKTGTDVAMEELVLSCEKLDVQ